jgi:DNA-binding response OmpR family regulator
MATALVITSESEYGSSCYPAFRANGLFPVVISTIERAVSLLKQFRADVIAVDAGSVRDDSSAPMRLAEYASGTPVVLLSELPEPKALVSRLRAVIDRHETR